MQFMALILNSLIVSLIFLSNVCVASENISEKKGKEQSYFTLAVIPDSQVLVDKYPQVFESQIKWIINNKAKENIIFVSHVGDIVEDYHFADQWDKAERIINRLDGIVPYGVLPGNHDMPYTGDSKLFQKRFPAKKYSKFPWYADNYRNNSNSCQLFSVPGLDFVIIHVECNPDDKTLSWVDKCLEKYSNRRAIIVTHSYLEAMDPKDLSKGVGRVSRISVPRTKNSKGNSPEQMWQKCFKKHANVFMILCGHRRRIQAYRQVSIGDNGNRVYELLSDYASSKDLDGVIGRGGYFRLMRFYPQKNHIEVKTYSPFCDKFLAASDLAPNLDAHDFILPYDMISHPPLNKSDKVIENKQAVQATSLKTPKYIFLFIGDGMGEPMVEGANDLSVAITGKKLNMIDFPVKRLTTTNPINGSVTDSAAAGTAIACGAKTKNGILGVSPANESLISIAELAKDSGMKAGVITTTFLNHATPAAFYAHANSRGAYNEIFDQLLKSKIDLAFGGMPYYSFVDKKSTKQIKEFIKSSLLKAGFAIGVDTKKELDSLSADKRSAFIYGNPGNGLPYARNASRFPNVPTLPELTKKSIELLDNPKGFFLMVEGGRIDWANHANKAAAGVYDTIAFDDAIGEALKFYRKHSTQTLIIVTSDHETGGITYLPKNPNAIKILEGFTGVFKDFPLPVANSYDEYLNMLDKQFNLKAYLGDQVFSVEQKDRLKKAFSGIKVKPSHNKNEEQVFVYEKKGKDLAEVTSKVLCELAGFKYSSRGHTADKVGTRVLGIGMELFNKPQLFDNTDIGEILKFFLKTSNITADNDSFKPSCSPNIVLK